jgi:hypothetical protein
MSDNIMCYAAKMPSEVEYFGVAVDKPECKKYLAKDIADWIKRGAIVEHVPLAVANDSLQRYVVLKI